VTTDDREPAEPPPTRSDPLLRLSDAGEDRSAWITLLTTEHYNLQTSRAATIGEVNGRASIFLGATSATLIALGFQGGGRTPGATTFTAVVLTSLAFLGVVTFLRCLEVAIDDWDFARRITALRAAYSQLVPELAELLSAAAGPEQAASMLRPRQRRWQVLLSAAGTVGVLTSIILGADVGALTYGLGAPLGIAIAAGTGTGLAAAAASVRFQRHRWAGAAAAASFTLG
jgi:hypothetical protein